MPPISPLALTTSTRPTSPSMEAILGLTLDNPLLSDEAIAKITGRTKTFVANIRKSDHFRSVLASRLDEKYGATKGKLREKLADLAFTVIDRANELAKTSSVSLPELTQLLGEVLSHVPLAIAQPGHTGPVTSVQVNVIPSDVAARIQQARQESLDMSSSLKVIPHHEVIDVTVEESPARGSHLAKPEYVPEDPTRSRKDK